MAFQVAIKAVFGVALVASAPLPPKLKVKALYIQNDFGCVRTSLTEMPFMIIKLYLLHWSDSGEEVGRIDSEVILVVIERGGAGSRFF